MGGGVLLPPGLNVPADWLAAMSQGMKWKPLRMPFLPFPFSSFRLNCVLTCASPDLPFERGFQMRQSRWPWLECVPRVHADTVLILGRAGLLCLGECPQWGQCLWESWSRGSSEAWIPSHDGSQRTVPLTFSSSHSRWLELKTQKCGVKADRKFGYWESRHFWNSRLEKPLPCGHGDPPIRVASSFCLPAVVRSCSAVGPHGLLCYSGRSLVSWWLMAQRTWQLFWGSGGVCRNMVLLMNSSMLGIYPVFFKLGVTVCYWVVRCILAGQHQH